MSIYSRKPSSQPLNFDFPLQPKQLELLRLVEETPVVNIGYGGSRGGGKSRAGRDVILVRRLKHPGTRGLIFRRTFGELWDNQIDKLFKERPKLREWYNTQTHTISLPNGSDIVFATAEHEGDINSFQGKEFMDILVDEATHLTEGELNFLRTCRRWPGQPDNKCKLICTMNPGGVGHTYMKRIFIDRYFKDNEIPGSFTFIQAHGWDNVEWARHVLKDDGFTEDDYYAWSDDARFKYFVTRTQYGRDLDALPESMRIQHLYGRWDYFEGQVFPELSEKIHNLDRWFNTADSVQWGDFHKGLKIIGSLDHAMTGITTYGLVGVDVDENMFGLEEYYQKDRLISEHAAEIRSLKARYAAPVYQLIDPSTEAKTMQNKHEMFSVQDAYRREGLLFISAHRASVSIGLDLIKQYLKVDPLHRNPFTGEKGSPRLFISRRRNPNLWTEMAELQCVNEDGKVKFIGRDHAIDRLRYSVMSRPRMEQRQQSDLLKRPSPDQFAYRSHKRWAKGFDQQVDGGGKTYF